MLQLSIKNEQKLDCGGAYIKLLGDIDQESFGGDSPYQVCGGDVLLAAPPTVPGVLCPDSLCGLTPPLLGVLRPDDFVVDTCGGGCVTVAALCLASWEPRPSLVHFLTIEVVFGFRRM